VRRTVSNTVVNWVGVSLLLAMLVSALFDPDAWVIVGWALGVGGSLVDDWADSRRRRRESDK
jgi:Flp pilus assembly protein protease CpaA